MKKVLEKFKALCTAVSFAEHGEWNDAINIADGKFTLKGADGKHVQTLKKAKKRYVDNRPKLQL